MASPSSHEVRMVEPSRPNTRPLRARSLAGILLFDENDTSDWQDTVWEAQLTESLDEHDRQEIMMDQQAQPDTDVPGVWRCQIEPKSDLYGDKTGKLLDPEKVIKGRLTELKHMNDHHVYDWIDEAEIPKGTKVETSRWLDDIKPRDGDENSVHSRIVVQQYNVDKRLDVHQGTPPLKVLRMLLGIGHEQRFAPSECVRNLGRQCCVLSLADGCIHRGETTGGVASAWQAMGSEESTLWHSDGQQVFWEIGW